MSKVPHFVEEFNSSLDEAHNMCVLARHSAIQNSTIDSLHIFEQRLRNLKAEYVEQGNEEFANLILGFQFVAQTLISELRMYVLLKQEKADCAWDELISAQNFAIAAMKAHAGFSHLERKVRRLEAIEELMFPHQVFLSTGMRVDEVECSICHESYIACEHVKGKPYLGELCHLIITKASLHEVSIVDCPKDKRCRVTHFNSKEGRRNRMSWKIEE